MKIKLFEMFAGYGGGSFALKKAGIQFECVGYSEIEKHAIKCYEQNHPNVKNYGDCKSINPDELPDFDLLMGGFPCQDVSIAGDRDLSKGRTNLFTEIIRIAKAKKPKYMLLENVKGLLSSEKFKLNKSYFDRIKEELRKIGYGICHATLNSKDYGIPQNRERVWIVCKYGGWDFMEFAFPEKKPLKITLKDILETNVNEKYNIREKALKLLKVHMGTSYASKFNPDISNTLRTNYGNGYSNESYILQHSRSSDGKEIHYNVRNIAGTIKQPSGNTQNLVLALDLYNKKAHSDRTPALTEPHHNTLRLFDGMKIRKFTPKECFKLMGFLNDEINIEGISDSQLYSLAGNGWDINIVSLILKRLFYGNHIQ